MRALRYDRYGPPDVLHVEDVAEPASAADELKVRVRAASLNPLDWKIRAGHMRLIPLFDAPPRGTGTDFAGEVVGSGGGDVAGFYPGARVFGSLSPFRRQGSIAEFVVVAASRIATAPDMLAFDAAAALPIAAGTAVQALADHAQLAGGQRLLLSGAAGGVGHYAIQYAKHVGAHVTAVCSTTNLAFVESLGADRALDYTRDDPLAGGEPYDVVFDAAGVWSWQTCRGVLAPSGVYVNTAPSARAIGTNVVGAAIARLTTRQRVVTLALQGGAPMWRRLAELAADGALTPHITRRLAIDDVADAQRAMESGHGRGKLVAML